jgi:hypothetical protein
MPDSYQPPVSGEHHDPYRVTEIQKDKETQDSLQNQESVEPKHHSAFVAYAIIVLKKFFDLFEHTTEQGLRVSAESNVLEHLTLFKAALETLKLEDRSQDSSFLVKLSDLWHQILDDSYSFRRQSLLSMKIRSFIKEFQHYPEQSEHSIGYYLTEYAGQTWLPFPYMEMIRQIHLAHKKNPQKSSLSIWSNELEAMIQIIKPVKE